MLRKLALALQQSGKGMDKAQKELLAALIAAAVQDIMQLTMGSRKTETGILAADLLMQAGEEEDALKMLEKLQAEAVPESIDWKRVSAMARQLRASSSGYHSAMAAADEAGRAGDAKRERSALARAAGFLPGRRDLLERTRQNKYNPLPALNLVLRKMQNGIGGAPVKYAIRARSLELHVDLAGNDQLADLTPLSQFPITHLDISDTRVADLMPLSMVPLQVLRADRTPVTTLSPVAKGPLRLLTAEGGAVTDDGSLDSAQILTNYRGTMRGGSLARKESTASWGQTWVNSLGMTFQAITEHSPVLISRDETLIDHFLAAGGARGANDTPPLPLPDAVPTPGPVMPSSRYPITSITLFDARAFCQWLTERERAKANISVRATYRLLTNGEWNQAAGYVSPDLTGKSPLTSSGPLYTVRGNLPDSGPMTWLTGTTGTPPGPSGTFRSLLGIHDLGNGIQEWSQDTISPTSSPIRDLPGEWALWNSGTGFTFPPSAAGPASPMGQADLGFRIALELPPIPW